jgi:6-phosphogluconolactonase
MWLWEIHPRIVMDSRLSQILPKGAPHPHWTGFSPDGKFAFVPDLGTDGIHVYGVSLQEMSLKLLHEIKSVPGGGPRHMRFSVDGRYIYLLNELQLSVSTFRYDASTGRGVLVSTMKALSDEELAQNSFNSAAEILVHPNGRFLYTSNRGHDSVSVFDIKNPERPECIQVEPVRGAWPRNIQIHPSGQWLFAAGADSHTLATFKVDVESGRLSFLRKGVQHVPKPLCILFAD